MSKRALKRYVTELPRPELEGQLMALYERFPAVKKYYDFVFNPREEALVQEAKAKVRNEYFPKKRRRPRARRSVAQRYIKQFRKLEMAPSWVAELMAYNLETAMEFEGKKRVPETFYKSMLNSFTEWVQYTSTHQLLPQFKDRILVIYQMVLERNWNLSPDFDRAMDILD